MLSHEDNALELKLQQVVFANWQPQIEVNEQIYKLDNLKLTTKSKNKSVLNCSITEIALELEISFEQQKNTVWIKSEIINHADKPVKLGKFFLLNADVSGLAKKNDQLVVIPWQVWNMQRVYEINDPELPELAKVLTQFQNNTQNIALQVAFTSFQRANTELIIQRNNNGLQHLKAYCDFAQWELHAGQSTSTEKLRIMYGNNPYKQLESWADEVNKRLQPKIWEEAPLGYLGWSWGDSVNGSENYEEMTMANLDAINTRLGGFGFKYLWTSMANFKGSLPGNWLKWNDEQLPCGQEKFIKTVQGKGFVPGFWVGPFYLCSMLEDLIEELGEAILETPDGEKLVVCPRWRHGDAGKIPKEDRPCLYALDPSHPKTLNFISPKFSVHIINGEFAITWWTFWKPAPAIFVHFRIKKLMTKVWCRGPEAYTNFLRIMKKKRWRRCLFAQFNRTRATPCRNS